jgi:hypothetical protein
LTRDIKAALQRLNLLPRKRQRVGVVNSFVYASCHSPPRTPCVHNLRATPARRRQVIAQEVFAGACVPAQWHVAGHAVPFQNGAQEVAGRLAALGIGYNFVPQLSRHAGANELQAGFVG